MRRDNLAFARSFYDAFTGGDTGVLRELIDADASWHVGGNNSLTGTYVGRDAIFELFARIAEVSGGSFSLEVHDLLVSDDHVVALNLVGSRRVGVETQERIVHVLHVTDGKLAEFWGFPENTAGFDEAWR